MYLLPKPPLPGCKGKENTLPAIAGSVFLRKWERFLDRARLCRFPLDNVGFQKHASFMRLVVQRLDQKIDRELALRLRVIIQRGQLRIGNFRIDTVIDADDADVFGNLAAALEQRTQAAGRGEVNRIDDAVDRRVLAEDMQCIIKYT